MRVIQPITINNFTSTAPVSSLYDYDSSQSYGVGGYVQYLNKEYVSLLDNNINNQPDIVLDNPAWQFSTVTNPYKMFDSKTSNQTTANNNLIVNISTIGAINSMAFFNMRCDYFTVEVSTIPDGVVYESGVVNMSNFGITNWFEYFFNGFSYRTDIAFFDLPISTIANIKLSFYGLSIEVGQVVMGMSRSLGITGFGAGVGITDYSTKETDEFGNFEIVERKHSKRASFDFMIETDSVYKIQNFLSKYRTTPIVWAGDPSKPSTIIYGYYRDFDIVIPDPSASFCSIEIEGL